MNEYQARLSVPKRHPISDDDSTRTSPQDTIAPAGCQIHTRRTPTTPRTAELGIPPFPSHLYAHSNGPSFDHRARLLEAEGKHIRPPADG